MLYSANTELSPVVEMMLHGLPFAFIVSSQLQQNSQ